MGRVPIGNGQCVEHHTNIHLALWYRKLFDQSYHQACGKVLPCYEHVQITLPPLFKTNPILDIYILSGDPSSHSHQEYPYTLNVVPLIKSIMRPTFLGSPLNDPMSSFQVCVVQTPPWVHVFYRYHHFTVDMIHIVKKNNEPLRDYVAN